MTKTQRKEHKMGNALRRANILKLAHESDPTMRYYWASARVGRASKYADAARARIESL